MSEKSPTLTILAAAELMGVKRDWARVLLTRRHSKHPERGLLSRPPGSPRGNIMVDARALRDILRRGSTEAIEELTSRVGILEADLSTTCGRIKRIERKIG